MKKKKPNEKIMGLIILKSQKHQRYQSPNRITGDLLKFYIDDWLLKMS